MQYSIVNYLCKSFKKPPVGQGHSQGWKGNEYLKRRLRSPAGVLCSLQSLNSCSQSLWRKVWGWGERGGGRERRWLMWSPTPFLLLSILKAPGDVLGSVGYNSQWLSPSRLDFRVSLGSGQRHQFLNTQLLCYDRGFRKWFGKPEEGRSSGIGTRREDLMEEEKQ